MRAKIFLLGLTIGHIAAAQTFSERITRDLVFEKRSPDNALVIANINGNVKVTAYEGDHVIVAVDKFLQAKTEARLEKAKQDVQLGIIDLADTLILYVRDGCNHFGKERGEGPGKRWNYHYDSDHDCRVSFHYRMDFTVKVPASLHLRVSTINEGDVIVQDVGGSVVASNINGSIRLNNVMNQTEAHTINGAVYIVFARNPEQPCRFYALNGDINASFQPQLSADVSFKSFNGDLYTNIFKLEKLPTAVQKTSAGGGLRYEITGNRFQAGRGGALLQFETFNGNVYIKEKK